MFSKDFFGQFSHLWWLLCVQYMNALSQDKHLKGFSPVCLLQCCLRLHSSNVLYSQIAHFHKYWSCTFMCFFNSPSLLNHFLHMPPPSRLQLHLRVASFLWITAWLLSWLSKVKCFTHFAQENFNLSLWLYMWRLPLLGVFNSSTFRTGNFVMFCLVVFISLPTRSCNRFT